VDVASRGFVTGHRGSAARGMLRHETAMEL